MTTDKILPKDETYGKMGRLTNPKIYVLAHMILLVSHFLCHPKSMSKTFRVSIVKIIDYHEKLYHKNQVAPSSHVQLIDINKRILCHTITLSIPFKTRKTKILCGNSKGLLHTRDQLSLIILTTQNIIIMLWLDDKHGDYHI